ncbi:permease-like cell division protein FtsX [Curtobacterium aurantiacum]|uniref:Cell division protein FtsX n=1 Tax=Curtobacterium aurantiacum TaxID=3236919 RepID=A0ABS5VFT0_9MICO|nr:permease-like cell division protein FtsX [Curtobacterium flaccumfaciens]MBT1545186.1 permease-like cell division protein FtsX [Curtobacterium flaccumfaciens pv. flaccumfaciens]MBT1587967.1 permease-like cell division protein FtsX [Curtobacterium flaccumfaciens pv. flaccumfaciens]MBT1676530.1 permease-like cell division protein FtsX [Curtobacterium flaccumfaciens pv. flaccumfaciens]MBT1678248.1 permease-like cell division protein FtsX [Curtobacterium flaccumfaciens pv. flaccumfaciens]
MRLGLVMSEVGSGLRRNASMVVSVVLVTFISLTFVGTAILLQMQINQMKGYWYDRAQVAVYLCTETDTTGNCTGAKATEDQREQVQAQLESSTLKPYIEKTYYENQDQAFARFKEQFKESAATEFVKPEYLNETFWVNLKNPSQADVLVESLSKVAGVQSVSDQRSYLQPIFNLLNASSYTAIGIAALMLVAAVLLIATTIRLSAFSRRRELGIMRLVGASNRFIQTPFVLEGVIAAAIGAVLAGGAITAVVWFFVRNFLAERFRGTAFIGMGDAAIVVPAVIVIGVLLAAASASIAIRRYLKV